MCLILHDLSYLKSKERENSIEDICSFRIEIIEHHLLIIVAIVVYMMLVTSFDVRAYVYTCKRVSGGGEKKKARRM
jgi:hypothetical protein